MGAFSSQSTVKWANQLNDLRQRWAIKREIATVWVNGASGQEWMPVVQFERKISEFARNDLLSIKTQLIEINHGMKSQLDIARSRSAAGEYSDPSWYREMQQAIMSVSRHIQVVDAALSEKPRAKGTKTLPYCFMSVAEKMLDKSLFEKIKLEAKNKMERTDEP